MAADRGRDTFRPQLSADYVDQVRRSGKTTDRVNNVDGVIDRLRTVLSARVPFHRYSEHRHELALSIAVAVDVSLSRLDRPVASQQLNVAQ